eukprot:5119-Chlamydomonas_euryale.AAC.4
MVNSCNRPRSGAKGARGKARRCPRVGCSVRRTQPSRHAAFREALYITCALCCRNGCPCGQADGGQRRWVKACNRRWRRGARGFRYRLPSAARKAVTTRDCSYGSQNKDWLLLAMPSLRGWLVHGSPVACTVAVQDAETGGAAYAPARTG